MELGPGEDPPPTPPLSLFIWPPSADYDPLGITLPPTSRSDPPPDAVGLFRLLE